MSQRIFDTIWYLPSENSWKDFNMLAFRDSGRLIVNADSIQFVGSRERLIISDIQHVSLGKQGRDFVNDWIKVEYGQRAVAYFADGSWLGWGGIFGGTQKPYAALYYFNQNVAPASVQ